MISTKFITLLIVIIESTLTITSQQPVISNEWQICCQQPEIFNNGTGCEQTVSSIRPTNIKNDCLKLDSDCSNNFISFWKCIEDNNDNDDINRPTPDGLLVIKDEQLGETTDRGQQNCCKIKTQNRADLLDRFEKCNENGEMRPFYSCLIFFLAKNMCCPNDNQRQFCQCLKNQAKVTQPQMETNNNERNQHCCEKSDNHQCRQSCHNLLSNSTNSQQFIMEMLIENGCGHPAIHDSLWQCFLSNSKNERHSNSVTSSTKRTHVPLRRLRHEARDLVKLHCCSKATSLGCQQLCLKTFANEFESNWRNFDRSCLYHQRLESNMIRCLNEVEEPCQLGCNGLSYCNDFNDSLESFRSCNAYSDSIAQLEYNLLEKYKQINTSQVSIAINFNEKCPPSMWKRIACSSVIKPCTGSDSFIRGLCWSDCVNLLTKCANYDKMDRNLTPEAICDILFPGYNEATDGATCTIIKNYIGGSDLIKKSREVTFPCLKNKCKKTEVCHINRDCHVDHQCPSHKCIPGCRMGNESNIVVQTGSLVYIATISGCQKLCRCSSKTNRFDECVTLPCQSMDSCWVGGKKIAHQTVFQVDCNICTCFAGEQVCSNEICPNSRQLTGLPCNCPDHYAPVCGTNGRTYPSACVASCAGLTDRQIEFGACETLKNPCQSNPCKRVQRCLHVLDVCLGLQRPCPKYKCIDINGHSASNDNDTPMCGTNHVTYNSLCSLLLNKDGETLAYPGKCNEICRQREPVCGQDGQIYQSQCAAWANRVYVDYKGPCRNNYRNSTSDGISIVQCPHDKLICHSKVITPGTFCPICGSALKLIYSRRQIDQFQESVIRNRLFSQLFGINDPSSQVTVKDIVTDLRKYLTVAECDVFGYLSIEGDLIIVFTVANFHRLQSEACVREANKIRSMIELKSPEFLSDFILSTGIVAVQPIVEYSIYSSSITPTFSSSLLIGLLYIFVINLLLIN